MKDKIIKDIHERICNGFNVKFIPSNVFENEFNILSKEFSDKFIAIKNEYDRLKNSKLKEDYLQIINQTKEEYFENYKNSHWGEFKYKNTEEYKQIYKHLGLN